VIEPCLDAVLKANACFPDSRVKESKFYELRNPLSKNQEVLRGVSKQGCYMAAAGRCDNQTARRELGPRNVVFVVLIERG
jgi:hypothetical protein